MGDGSGRPAADHAPSAPHPPAVTATPRRGEGMPAVRFSRRGAVAPFHVMEAARRALTERAAYA